MTTFDRPVTRITSCIDGTRGGRRPLVVRCEPKLCRIRAKGRRNWLAVDWNSIFSLAARMEMLRIKAEKKAAREERKKGRA